MPKNQLRSSGIFQAAIVALLLGLMFRQVPSNETPSTWPYLLATYAALVAMVPWLIGGISKNEVTIGYSIFLGVAFAAPVSLSAYWLWPTPYHYISWRFAALAFLWGIHFAVSIILRLLGRST